MNAFGKCEQAIAAYQAAHLALYGETCPLIKKSAPAWIHIDGPSSYRPSQILEMAKNPQARADARGTPAKATGGAP